MPTYTVTTTRQIGAVSRDAIANAIADSHTRVTGAGRIFAQVVFITRSPDMVTVGGAPADEDHIFIDATIRGGRERVLVDRLVSEVTRAVASAASVNPKSIWLYIRELDPSRMVEYGSVLPAPGEEDAWLAATFEPEVSADNAQPHTTRSDNT